MTTLKQCITAWQALRELMNAPTDYRSAHALVLLKSRLRPHVEFYHKEELALSDKYAEHDEKGKIKLTAQGTVEFGTTERLSAFLAERAELDAVELTEDIPVAHITAPAQITPEQLEALEHYIDFEEDHT